MSAGHFCVSAARCCGNSPVRLLRLACLGRTRAQINSASPKDGDGQYKISVNDFVTKASALALRDVPEVNSSWMGTAIRHYKSVDINIAVQTDAGLFTPMLSGVDQKGLEGISSNIRELAGKARENKLMPADLAVRASTRRCPVRTQGCSFAHGVGACVCRADWKLHDLQPWDVRD